MSKELTHRADELPGLGWSKEDVNRYAELWDYRQRWGAINLERDDRLFLKKVEASLPKQIVGKTSVKKPIQEKSYYRWLKFYLDEMNKQEQSIKLKDGLRGIWPIMIEEELRALDYYQPVLGLPDTLKAKKLDNIRESLEKSVVDNDSKDTMLLKYDFQKPIETINSKESLKWRPLRISEDSQGSTYPAISVKEEQRFRDDVRSRLIALIPDIFPSLLDTDKPMVPDDWTPNENS